MRLFARLFALTGLLWCPVVTNIAASAGGRDDGAVRDVLLRFAQAYADGNSAEMVRLWADDADALRLSRIRFEGLHLARCVSGRGVAIEAIEIDGDRAKAAITLAVEKRVRATGALVGAPLAMVNLRVQLVRRNGAWLIGDVASAEAELAAQIADAPTLAAREQLLFDRPQLFTPALVRELHQLGVVMVNGRTPSAAGPIADLALQIARAHGDTAGEAFATSLKGVVARLAGDVDEALALTGRALELARASGDHDALSRTLHTRIAALKAQDEDSPESLLLAAEMYEAAQQAEDRVHLVRALSHRIDNAIVAGDLLRARAAAEESEKARQAVGDDMSAHVVPLMLAGIYRDQENYELALHHARRGLAHALRLQSDKIARAHALIGSILARQGKLAAAEESLTAAIATVGETGDAGALAVAHEGLADVRVRQGKLAEAECEMREAMQAYRRFGIREPSPRFEYIAQRALDDGQPALALKLSLEEAAVAPRYIAHSLGSRITASRAYRALGTREPAESILREAVALVEERADEAAGAEEQQVRVGARAADVHRELADLLAEDRRDGDALRHAELAKSRVLLGVIRNGRTNAAMTEADLTTERQLETRIAAATRALADVAERTSEHTALGEELMRLRHELASFRDGLYVRQPRLRVDRGAIDVPSLAALAATLPANAAFIEYVVVDGRTHVFVLRAAANGSRYTLTHRTIAMKAGALRSLVARYAGRIQRRDLSFRPDAKKLYGVLIAPVEDALAGATTVCIVPDDVLWQVPFAALIDSRGSYLIERHALAVVPSMSVYAAMQQRPRSSVPGSRTLFAVGNPKLSGETATSFAGLYRDAEVGDLPEAAEEALAVGALYGADASTILTGERAAEARAKSEAGRYRVLHFATHGMLDDVNPMYSRLLLARDRTSATDDGYLEAREIMQLDLRADLAVLSACDTARGTVGGGEGVIGLTWAFFVAGVKSTVATQWKITSRGATRLGVDFHTELLRRRSATAKAEALRHAQLALMKEPQYAHPFYWAPFVLYGAP